MKNTKTLKNTTKLFILFIGIAMIFTIGITDKELFVFANKAPDFNLKTLDGKQVSPSSFKGKPVILWFMALSCPSCYAQADIVKQISTEYKDKVDVMVIDILGDTNAALQNFIANFGSSDWKVTVDTDKVSIKYGITVTDSTVILDGNGNIVYKNLGPATYQSIKDAIYKALSST